MGKKVVWHLPDCGQWPCHPLVATHNNSSMMYQIEWNEEGTACKQVPGDIINSCNLHQFKNRFDKFMRARPNKI